MENKDLLKVLKIFINDLKNGKVKLQEKNVEIFNLPPENDRCFTIEHDVPSINEFANIQIEIKTSTLVDMGDGDFESDYLTNIYIESMVLCDVGDGQDYKFTEKQQEIVRQIIKELNHL